MKNKIFSSPLMGLIPTILFVIFAFIMFSIYHVYDFAGLGAMIFIALILVSFISKDKKAYWTTVIDGMSDRIIIECIAILTIVYFFAKLMSASGVAEGFIWLGHAIGMKGNVFTLFTFIASGLIATATGSAFGTIFSSFPIFYPAGIILGSNPVMLAGAIVSGAFFGDNVGPISDTTIISSSTQTYINKEGSADIVGVVFSRMKYALIAAALAGVCFLLIGGGSSTGDVEVAEELLANSGPKGLLMLIAMAVLIAVAYKTRNIYIASISGIIVGTVIGLVSGLLSFSDVIYMDTENGVVTGFFADGINSNLANIIFLLGVGGVIGVLRGSGFFELIMDKVSNSSAFSGPRGTELCIALGQLISASLMSSSNGPAIMLWGPIANEIGRAERIHPYRRANLCDGFSCGIPLCIPFTSIGVLIPVSVIAGLTAAYPFIETINPVSLAIALLYPIFLTVVMLFSVFSGWNRSFEGPNGELIKGKTYEEALAKAGLTDEGEKVSSKIEEQ